MADLTALSDVGHYWGSDTRLSATGGLDRSAGAQRSKERVLRRLLTNPGDCIFHPDYGAGLPQRVGSNVNAAEIKALVRTQMRLEPSVARNPEPAITVREIPNGVSLSIAYTSMPDKQPVALTFSVSA